MSENTMVFQKLMNLKAIIQQKGEGKRQIISRLDVIASGKYVNFKMLLTRNEKGMN